MHPANSPSPAARSIYTELFVNRTDAFMTFARAAHWIYCKRSLSQDVLSAALSGRSFLGFYSVSETGLSRWCCLDLDDSAKRSQLIQVTGLLDDPNAAVVEQSRRGLHLWLLVEPTPWELVNAWGQDLVRQVGLAGIEVFPKGPGYNGVRAPLTRHPKDGRIYPFLDAESGEIINDPWTFLSSRRPGRRPVVSIPAIQQHVCTRPSRTGSTDHRALVAEVERYTRLRFYGDERAIGRCPFHDDRHPSFGVVGGYWKCFAGCGSGGLTAFRARIESPSPSTVVSDNVRLDVL